MMRSSGVMPPQRSQPRAGAFRTAAYWALLVFVFSVPWQGFADVGSVGTISKVLGFVAVGIAAVAVLLEGVRHRLVEAHVAMIAFTGWSVLSIAWSLFPDDSRSAALTFAQLLVTALLIWEFADSRARLMGVMRAFVAGCVVLAVNVVQQYLALGEEVARIGGSGAHPNDVAFVLCLGIPLAWYLSLRTPYGVELLAARGYVLLALYAIVLTASRSALVIAGLALLIVPLSYSRLSAGWRVGLVLLILASFVVAPPFLPERQVDRLATFSTELQDGDLSARAQIWSIALDIMAEHPLKGTGVGAGRRLIAGEYGLAEGAHNTYLSVALETGAVGLALFGFMLYAIFRRGRQVAGLERGLIVVIGLCLLVGLLPRHWENEKALWVMLAIVVSLGAHIASSGHRRQTSLAREQLAAPAAPPRALGPGR